ncbi:MAG: hypothetical protein ABIE70_05460 [bacterium]
MRRVFITIVVILSLAAGSTSALEAPARLSEGLGGAVVISNPTAGDCLNTPGIMKDRNGGSVELGYRRQFEMSALDDRSVSAMLRRGRLGFAAGLSQFGQSELYAETRLHGAAAITWRRWSLGLAGTAMLVEFGGPHDKVWTSSLDVGATMTWGRGLLALSINDLMRPRLTDRVDQLPPRLSLYGELIGSGAYSTLARVTVQNDQRPQFAVGQALFVSDYAWLLWSVSTAPTRYGGGLQVSRGALRLSWVTSYHPDLGFSYTAGLSFDFRASKP